MFRRRPGVRPAPRVAAAVTAALNIPTVGICARGARRRPSGKQAPRPAPGSTPPGITQGDPEQQADTPTSVPSSARYIRLRRSDVVVSGLVAASIGFFQTQQPRALDVEGGSSMVERRDG